jgi:hypothetical protein
VTAISLAAVPDILDPDLVLVLIDRVEHPVVASPDSKDAWYANERLHIRWPRIPRELANQRVDLLPGGLIQVE